MIGVAVRPDQLPVAAELFELFKTPWEPYRSGRPYDVVIATTDEPRDADARLLCVFGAAACSVDGASACAGEVVHGARLDYDGLSVPLYGPLLTFDQPGAPIAIRAIDGRAAAVRLAFGARPVIRFGFDLFDEVRALIVEGQPVEHAGVPTLDAHIAMLRSSILGAGIALVELPPVPAGRRCFVCLTHDIDFVAMRDHLLDHSMWGFLYRSTVGSVTALLRRRIGLGRAWRMWRAAASLPFVFLGWARDFWEPFEWYLRVEDRLPATYYVIPFKHRAGERATVANAAHRATAYDAHDVRGSLAKAIAAGCEIGVHGIDAWHSVEKGCEERARVSAAANVPAAGIRMHWLFRDASTAAVLDEAGYAYDSTCGYNETIGFRNGTAQAYRPLGVRRLLELPMHIQDGALFFSDRLDLTEEAAWARCAPIIEHARRAGGVITLLWHDRSHGPERFWGEFYARLVRRLESSDASFATAADVVKWFRRRRSVRFDAAAATGARVRATCDEDGAGTQGPALTVRYHVPPADAATGSGRTIDVSWDGRTPLDLDPAEVGERPQREPSYSIQ